MMPHQPPSIGVIGCGHILRTTYAPVLQSLCRPGTGQVRVAAFCDISEDSAKGAAMHFTGAQTYSDAHQMLSREKLDAVVVLTPEAVNAKTATMALNAGVPVFLEKPPAVSIDEWQMLMEVENARGVPVYTAFNRRHTPLFKEWRPPTSVHRIIGILSRRNRPTPGFPFTAVHLIDSAQYFAGSIFSETRVELDKTEGGLEWHLEGKLENGLRCDLTFIPAGPEHMEFLEYVAPESIWGLQFPNPASTVHPTQGSLRMIWQRPNSTVELADAHQPARGQEQGTWENDPLETMGYAPCFRDFLKYLTGTSKWEDCPHRLPQCGGTIRVLEQTLNLIRSSMSS